MIYETFVWYHISSTSNQTHPRSTITKSTPMGLTSSEPPSQRLFRAVLIPKPILAAPAAQEVPIAQGAQAAAVAEHLRPSTLATRVNFRNLLVMMNDFIEPSAALICCYLGRMAQRAVGGSRGQKWLYSLLLQIEV